MPSAAEVAQAAAAKDAAAHGFEVVPRGHGRGDGAAASDSDDSSDTDDEGRVVNRAQPPADAELSDDEDQDFMDSLDAQGKVTRQVFRDCLNRCCCVTWCCGASPSEHHSSQPAHLVQSCKRDAAPPSITA